MIEDASRRPVTPDTVLIYIHITKNAGTTLNQIVAEQYPPDAFYYLRGDPDLYRKSYSEFMGLNDEQKRKIRCIATVLPFGVYEWLQMTKPALYLTFLRHPVDRAISIYYYSLRTPHHYLHETIVSNKISFEEFVQSLGRAGVDNVQTRMMGGYIDIERWEEVQNDPLPPDAFETAKRNLTACFPVVGIVDQFDESLLLMKKHFGWGNVFYVKRNVSRNRPAISGISSETLAYLESINQEDLQLYAFFKQRLQEQIRTQGMAFQLELRAFRMRNKMYNLARQYQLERYANLPQRSKARVKAALKSVLKIRE